MNDCIFCKILKGEIPSVKVYEDDYVYAFRDVNPQTETHILVIPREHITGISAVSEDNFALAGKCLEAAAKIGKQENLESYRVISNCGAGAGQTVFHLHFHILSGKGLSEKLI